MGNKMTIVEAFNVLYKDVVNNSDFSNKSENAKYNEARNYIQCAYEELNAAVMEFLAMFMLKHPNGKVQFMPSKEGLGLVCDYDGIQRILAFNYGGVIVKDEKSASSKEKEC